jgi:hypothetical protein
LWPRRLDHCPNFRRRPCHFGRHRKPLGITDAVYRDHFFHSVDEAVRVLAKKTNEFPEDKE